MAVEPAVSCQSDRKLRHTSSCVSACVCVCLQAQRLNVEFVCAFDTGTAWSTAKDSAPAKFPFDVTPAGQRGQRQATLGRP